MENKKAVPYHRPSIGEEEIQEVVDTLRSGWLTTGPRTARFEQGIRDYVGVPYAQAVSSCTAGLHLALTALELGPGDEVITTPMTFCATVNVILHVGATPVLADVGPDGNIDPLQIMDRITPRTRAVIPVHFAGLPCDMRRIWNIANRQNLCVIEDAAHAIGARYLGEPIGGSDPLTGLRSEAVVFSFYATKNMTTGEGGMVTSHEEKLIDTVRTLCLHGIDKAAWNRYSDKGNWYYEVTRPGFKYNLTDIQSAIGIHQLKKLDSFIDRRAHLAALYNELLADCEEVETPPDRGDSRHAWHLYVLRLRTKSLSISRNDFIQKLKDQGVGTSVHFIPVPLHPFFAQYAREERNACPKAIALYSRSLSLPLFPAMEESDVERVAQVVRDTARRARRQVFAVGMV
ncbi:MAG: DegT/DnrJ/EryC1/StrS aminotransferase family protein [Acidobacteriota bacterium]|nr:DegT/DnrJ/EryC1/StrS aminotransferase family protein [Acidobacteriota bacterium]